MVAGSPKPPGGTGSVPWRARLAEATRQPRIGFVVTTMTSVTCVADDRSRSTGDALRLRAFARSYLFFARTAVAVGFLCRVHVSRSISSAPRQSRPRMASASARAMPYTTPEPTSASRHVLAATVLLCTGVTRGAAVSGSMMWW